MRDWTFRQGLGPDMPAVVGGGCRLCLRSRAGRLLIAAPVVHRQRMVQAKKRRFAAGI